MPLGGRGLKVLDVLRFALGVRLGRPQGILGLCLPCGSPGVINTALQGDEMLQEAGKLFNRTSRETDSCSYLTHSFEHALQPTSVLEFRD